MNGGKYHEWHTATISLKEKKNNIISSIGIRIENQGIFNIKGMLSHPELMAEILENGFGSVYSNVMWIDVNNDRYKMVNKFGDLLDVEMKVQPIGSYIIDNRGYAINGVYKDDWDTFYKHTSLQWLHDHLKKEGDSFSFVIRHLYNGEYRWTEAKTVCTRRDADAFHALYWIEDINDKVYGSAEMKDTLSSVEVGQWRLEIREDGAVKFTASPSLMRLLKIKSTEDNEAILKNIKAKIYPEDCEKVKNSILNLADNEETSFNLRLGNQDNGLRYYRCGVTCVAKNEIYTCYQGYGQDITEIMQPMVTSIKQAEELSFTDQLTGLRNRNYMESRCESFMRKDELPVSMIMADCNYLKETNDTLGHEYGDLVLQLVAKSIRSSLPNDSVAMRIGGDEFLILCARCPSEKAKRIINSIRQKMIEYSDKTLKLSASFGTYTICNENITFKEAYSRADGAMYEEKQRYHKNLLMSMCT